VRANSSTSDDLEERCFEKEAGEALPSSKLLTGSGVSPAAGLRAGREIFIVLQQVEKGNLSCDMFVIQYW
jgi:hypothetical protein